MSADAKDTPTAALIEIIERGRSTDDTLGGSVIVPNEVRINGSPLLTAGEPIKIHEILLGGPDRDLCRVTLTLVVRRITVAAEGDLTD